MKGKLPWLVICGVGLAAFLLGRLSAEPALPAPAEATGLERAQSAAAIVARPSPQSVEGLHEHPPEASASERAQAPVLVGPGLGAGPLTALPALEQGLASARRAARAPSERHLSEAVAAAAGVLEQSLARDPRALELALRRFARLRQRGELEFLSAVLGRIHDPQVEALALNMARAGDPEQRVAAFDLLDALEVPGAREQVLEALAGSEAPRLRRAALRALPPPRGASRGAGLQVKARLSAILRADPDPALRRQAALDLARWSPRDLAPVLQALAEDPAASVRAGCAFALEVAHNPSPRVLAALGKAMRPGEAALVRENAYKALGSMGPLPDALRALYLRVRVEQEAAGEAR